MHVIDVEKFDAGIKLSGQYEIWETKNSGDTAERTEMRIREGIFAQSRGSIVHPRFISYYLDASVQLEQNNQKTDVNSDWGHSIWYEGQANLDILKEHPYSTHLFWQRSQNEISYPFSRSRTIIGQSWGGNITWRNSIAPFTISYEDIESNSDVAMEDKQIRSVGGQIELAQNKGKTQADVRYSNIEEYGITYNRLTGNFQATYPITDAFESFTSARYYQRQEYLDQTSINGDQRFTYKASEDLNFSTHWGAGYDKYLDAIKRSLNGDIGFSWRLYKNFSTTGGFSAVLSQTNDNLFYSYGPAGGISYSRTTDIGLFGLGYNVTLTKQISEPKDRTSRVTDESHTYLLGLSIELQKKKIDTATIVVTDEIGAVIYQPGLDYTISQKNDSTFLDVPGGSSIIPNSIIKASYNFENSKFRAKSLNHTLGATWQYENFNAGYEFQDLSYFDVSGDVNIANIQEMRRERAYIRYMDQYLDSKIQIERMRKNANPYDQILFHQGISYSFSEWNINIKLNTDYYITEYVRINETRRGVQVGCDMWMPITRNLSFEPKAIYVTERYEKSKRNGYGGSIDIRYRYHSWKFRGFSNFLLEENNNNSQLYYKMLLEMERTF